MEVIFTLEEVGVFVVSLGLDSCMIDLKFTTAEVGGCTERLKGLSRDQVAT